MRTSWFEMGTEGPQAEHFSAAECGAVDFMKNSKKQFVRSVTENGAVGYVTTGHELLDLNFKVSSLRCCKEIEIARAFMRACYEAPKYAVKWMFFLRDIQEGLGERRSFRVCLRYMAYAHTDIARAVMHLIPEYGRYDDLLVYLDTPLRDEVCVFLRAQLNNDLRAMGKNEPVSLLAKWLPSINASSAKTRQTANLLAEQFSMTPREYRKILSKLRAYSNVVEVKISASAWHEVEYNKVPAKANLKYDAAFMRHDKERRAKYLMDTYLGEDTLNSKGLMPYDIVHRMWKHKYSCMMEDDFLGELLWKEMIRQGFQNDWGLEDAIVVADGSGSMYSYAAGQSKVTAIEVCASLAIYFAEQLNGVFHNKAITFSATPQFIELDRGKNLKEKLEIMASHCEIANTDIEAVFELLLTMALSHQVSPEELPKQVLIISDMEFDEAAQTERYSEETRGIQTLFEGIEKLFEEHGYHMPRLIFWNVCGRSNTIPMVNHENGLCLLSGFSQNAMKAASDREQKDPYQSLLGVLDGERYDPVERALESRGIDFPLVE